MADESQRAAFLRGEGDRWYDRNAQKLADKADQDPLLAELKLAQISPRRVLEIGCSNGWRLEAMRTLWGASAFGVDPSTAAVREGSASFPALTLKVGTADALPFEDGTFDLAAMGFCLYLCDRSDLFRIATEVDRILADGGHLAIFDFFSSIPYRNRYQHLDGINCYKMDYAAMFSWNPIYVPVRQVKLSHDGGGLDGASRDDIVAVTILKKDAQRAYVENPY